MSILLRVPLINSRMAILTPKPSVALPLQFRFLLHQLVILVRYQLVENLSKLT